MLTDFLTISARSHSRHLIVSSETSSKTSSKTSSESSSETSSKTSRKICAYYLTSPLDRKVVFINVTLHPNCKWFAFFNGP